MALSALVKALLCVAPKFSSHHRLCLLPLVFTQCVSYHQLHFPSNLNFIWYQAFQHCRQSVKRTRNMIFVCLCSTPCRLLILVPDARTVALNPSRLRSTLNRCCTQRHCKEQAKLQRAAYSAAFFCLWCRLIAA